VIRPVLLDTGCIVALLDRSERAHQRCVRAVTELYSPLVTCEAVIAESCYLLRRLKGAPEAVIENVERGLFAVPFRLDAAAAVVRGLMKKYSDLPIDFADACLIHLASELGTGRILTLDTDFDVYRWGRNRPFENLVPEST
jgi:predicted nucleic acid-binding protein